jgi:subtilase family serine protease
MVETQSLQPGNLVNLTAEVTMPVVAVGNYFIILVSDSDNTVTETDETNNTFALTVEIREPIFPDLIITAINTSSASVNAGNFLEFTTTVRNQGQANSDSTLVSFYLSADEILDAGDFLLGTEEVAGIVSSSQRVVGSSYQVPTSVAVGSYFIIGDVNPNDDLDEEDLTNNTSSEPIEILEQLFADLEVNFASVQPEALPAGQDGNLSFSIFNIGEGLANASTATIHLSTDTNLSTDDDELASVAIDPIDVGESSVNQVNFTINNTVSAGLYTLIVEIDANNDVQELDETNNLFNVSLEVLEPLKADLVPGQLAFDNSSINAGGTLGVSFDLTNIGETASVAGDVGVYFSDDNALDASDDLISLLTTNPLNVGANDQFNVSVPIPLDRSPGDYFIIVYADDSDVEDELDETNNTISGSITITEPLPGNLVVASVIPGVSSIALNEDLTVDVTLSNSEPNAVLASTLAVYLSNDASIDASDVIVETRAVDVLAGNASTVISLTLSFSSTLSTGDYFLIARADNDDVVTETNELDNEGSVAITLTEEVLGISTKPAVVAYPIPATRIVSVEVQNMAFEKEVKIIDMSGRVVFKEKRTGDLIILDLSSLYSGSYILSITDGVSGITTDLIKD